MTQTTVAKCALEYWRASGERTLARLASLVEHFAETNGETAHLEHHKRVAFVAVMEWEVSK